MAAELRLRRGSAGENDSFTGAQGEVTGDTTNKTLRVHDGLTPGGSRLATYEELTALPRAIDLIGGWDPTTNTVTGDPNNAQVTKGAPPSGYPIVDKLAYVVNVDGSFDLFDDSTLDVFTRGDIIIWSETTNTWLVAQGGGGQVRAQDVSFEDTYGGSVPDNVQSVVDSILIGTPSSVTNVGTGTGRVGKQIGSGTLELRTLVAGNGISITNNPNDLTVDFERDDLPAENVTYDNTASGMAATTAQEAIDEILVEHLDIVENGTITGKRTFTAETGVNFAADITDAGNGAAGDFRYNSTAGEFEGFFGGEWQPVGGGGVATHVVSYYSDGDITVEANTATLIDVNGASGREITLPPYKVGSYVIIGDYDGSCGGSRPITITPDGTDNIEGVNEPLYLTQTNVKLTFQCIDLAQGWKIVDGIGEGPSAVLETEGATGTFTSADGKTITVTDGLITGIA